MALGLVACGDATTPDEPATETRSGTVEISLSGFAFVPRTVTIETGSTLAWTNRDAARHTVSADDDSWGSGNLDREESYRRTFDEPDSYEYHATMVATIIVE